MIPGVGVLLFLFLFVLVCLVLLGFVVGYTCGFGFYTLVGFVFGVCFLFFLFCCWVCLYLIFWVLFCFVVKMLSSLYTVAGFRQFYIRFV